ncbi:MAG: FecR domain-containing protein [Chloroherpetonaceae bacterium]|nr:FecR domain-containing protein [Chloroherpetonaceae bacterium]
MSYLIRILGLLIFIPLFPSKDNTENIALVLRKFGSVKTLEKSANWVEIERGKPISAGTAVKTDKSGTAILKYFDGSIFRISEETEVVIRGNNTGKEDAAREIEINVGKFGFEVKRRENQVFKFTSSTSVASIKGTEGVFESKNDFSELTIISSEKPDDAAELIDIRSGEKVIVKVGENARFDFGTRKFRVRKITNRERRIMKQLIGQNENPEEEKIRPERLDQRKERQQKAKERRNRNE